MIGKLSEDQIDELLRKQVLGRIGCQDAGRNYVVPVNYVYDGRFILAHSAEGLKIDMMRKNPEVCFEVDEMLDYSHWRSAIVWGEFQELTEERDRYYAMKLFVDRLLHPRNGPGSRKQTPALPPHTPGTIKPVVYRIVVTEKTGRYEGRWT